MAKLSPGELATGLAHWTGTTSYTRHALYRSLLMTEGVMWLQENAECFWLVDAIASHVATNPKLRAEPFQSWNFERRSQDMAPTNSPHKLYATDGDSNRKIVSQDIEYTDFPLSEIRFYVVRDDGLNGWVIMLPGEY